MYDKPSPERVTHLLYPQHEDDKPVKSVVMRDSDSTYKFYMRSDYPGTVQFKSILFSN